MYGEVTEEVVAYTSKYTVGVVPAAVDELIDPGGYLGPTVSTAGHDGIRVIGEVSSSSLLSGAPAEQQDAAPDALAAAHDLGATVAAAGELGDHPAAEAAPELVVAAQQA